jgi:hypothetical protein
MRRLLGANLYISYLKLFKPLAGKPPETFQPPETFKTGSINGPPPRVGRRRHTAPEENH